MVERSDNRAWLGRAALCVWLNPPVEELARIAHARDIPFHTDAVQAVGKIPIDLANSEIDLLTLYAEGRGETVGNGKEGLFSRIKSAFS